LRTSSENNFVRIAVEIKFWMHAAPPIDAVRPSRCPTCGVASRKVGGKVMLHGHGVRERQQRGPATPDAAAAVSGIIMRRYHCQQCGAVITAAPESVAKHKLYSAPAIALALALFGVLRMAARDVRQRVSPWRVIGDLNAERWATLARWTRTVRTRKLFRRVRACPDRFTLRQVAERAAMTLAAQCPSPYATAPPAVRAFFGAARGL
jgi:hypothetical protein